MNDRRLALLLTTLWLAALSSAQALAQPAATAPAEANPTAARPAAVPADRPRDQIESRLASQATIRRDIEFALPGGLGSDPLLLDLFVPKAGDGPFPLVIWVHGGGWEGGDKSPCPALGLLREGFAVASVNYRLTDEAIFPAQIHDVKAAVRWLRAHAKEHKLDPDRFGAWGASAGGHLVALLGTSGGVAELEGAELGNADQSSRVQAVCDWYGPCDFSIMADIAGSNNKGMLFKLFGGPLKDKRDLATLASPVTHATSDDPPFLIQQGDKDNLVPVAQSQAMEAALKKAGVPVELMIVQGAGHGSLGPKANQRIREFFIKELKPAPASSRDPSPGDKGPGAQP